MKEAFGKDKQLLLDRIKSTIESNRRFAVFAHEEPDGDAIGSQAAMTLALQTMGKDVRSFRVDPISPALRFLDRDGVIKEYVPARDRKIIESAQVSVVLDSCDYFRLGEVGDAVKESPSRKINIDHHRDNAFFGDINYVRFMAGGAAELVFEVIRKLGVEISGTIAEAIYVGMSTDTVGFRYIDPEGNMFEVLRELIRSGIDVERLQERIYCNQPDSYLEDLGAILNSVNYENGGALAWFTLFASKYLSFYQRELASEALRQLLSMKKIRAAVMLHEERAGIEVWLRSKVDVDVGSAALRIGGGGHRTASGALIRNQTMEEAVRRTLKSVRGEMKG